MLPEFENSWLDLDRRLRRLERVSGLGAALRELESHHLNNGFLDDALLEFESRCFLHPDDPERFFRLQHNPRRAQRFSGAGRKFRASDAPAQGCFLCRDNIERQQQGAQLGYRIESGARAFLALTNPFPILPGHIVVASVEHRTQEWRFRERTGVDVGELVDDLVRLSERMPGYVGFYNGIDGGCSIPGHLHYQFVTRPRGVSAFPLECAARSGRRGADAPLLVRRYPVEAAVWTGGADRVVAHASDWLTAWGRRNCARLDDLTANFVATGDRSGGRVVLYFVPRHRAKSRMRGVGGIAGALEVLGEIVLAGPEAGTRLTDGSIDYFSLHGALQSLHTPLEPA